MSSAPEASAWDEHYQTGQLPWDTGAVESELVAVLKSFDNPPRRAVDVGCGTGTNTIYLAQQGAKVTGLDLSPKAVEMAQVKARSAGAKDVDFIACDILGEPRVPAAAADFVFDRGCFHCMAAEHRAAFAQRIHAMLAPGGRWLCLAGNADEKRKPGEMGPPQLRAGEIISAVEPLFEIEHLRAMRFDDAGRGRAPLGWSVLLRKRG